MKKIMLILGFLTATGLYAMESSVLDTKITQVKEKMDASKKRLDNIILLIQQASQSGGKDIEGMKKTMALIVLRRKEAAIYQQYKEEYESLVGQQTT